MTKTLAPETQAQVSSPATKSIYLLEVYLTATQRFTSCDRPIVWGGNTYYPFPFSIGEVKTSAGALTDSMEVILSNVSREISGLMLTETFRGKRLIFMRTFLADDYTITTPLIVFDGIIDDVSGKEEPNSAVIMATVITDLAYWQRGIPGRQYQATCPWVFKGTDCLYAGAETWCNRTWERCKVLLNQANYGGFRHLPKLEAAEIWWGKANPSSSNVGTHVPIAIRRSGDYG